MTAGKHQLVVNPVDHRGIATFGFTHCPQTDDCAVWHECRVDGCQPTHGDAEVDGEVLHGLEHRSLEGSWMSRDEPHNCGVRFADTWEDLDSVGTYTFDVDYDGEGNWYPVNVEKETNK